MSPVKNITKSMLFATKILKKNYPDAFKFPNHFLEAQHLINKKLSTNLFQCIICHDNVQLTNLEDKCKHSCYVLDKIKANPECCKRCGEAQKHQSLLENYYQKSDLLNFNYDELLFDNVAYQCGPDPAIQLLQDQHNECFFGKRINTFVDQGSMSQIFSDKFRKVVYELKNQSINVTLKILAENNYTQNNTIQNDLTKYENQITVINNNFINTEETLKMFLSLFYNSNDNTLLSKIKTQIERYITFQTKILSGDVVYKLNQYYVDKMIILCQFQCSMFPNNEQRQQFVGEYLNESNKKHLLEHIPWLTCYLSKYQIQADKSGDLTRYISFVAQANNEIEINYYVSFSQLQNDIVKRFAKTNDLSDSNVNICRLHMAFDTQKLYIHKNNLHSVNDILQKQCVVLNQIFLRCKKIVSDTDLFYLKALTKDQFDQVIMSPDQPLYSSTMTQLLKDALNSNLGGLVSIENNYKPIFQWEDVYNQVESPIVVNEFLSMCTIFCKNHFKFLTGIEHISKLNANKYEACRIVDLHLDNLQKSKQKNLQDNSLLKNWNEYYLLIKFYQDALNCIDNILHEQVQTVTQEFQNLNDESVFGFKTNNKFTLILQEEDNEPLVQNKQQSINNTTNRQSAISQ